MGDAFWFVGVEEDECCADVSSNTDACSPWEWLGVVLALETVLKAPVWQEFINQYFRISARSYKSDKLSLQLLELFQQRVGLEKLTLHSSGVTIKICCSSELTVEAGAGDASILSQSFRLDLGDPPLLGRLGFGEQFIGVIWIECRAIGDTLSTLFASCPDEMDGGSYLVQARDSLQMKKIWQCEIAFQQRQARPDTITRLVDMQQDKVEITQKPEAPGCTEVGPAVLEVLANRHIELPTAIFDKRGFLVDLSEAGRPAASPG
ncbi:hypothetical protein EJB05_44124 [Eragrostis curvula]|uniref:Uncharacterized protein n=1 Tax=Eragrostis curvula TaxID=38414 RepID=A0A5J9TGT7_9POAL|nr:hypothetical protein EJB05_44124 [Eragrostis curvula]